MSTVFNEAKDSINLLKNVDYAQQLTKFIRKNGAVYDVGFAGVGSLNSDGGKYLVFECLDTNHQRTGFIACDTDAKVLGPTCLNLSAALYRLNNVIKSKNTKQGR